MSCCATADAQKLIIDKFRWSGGCFSCFSSPGDAITEPDSLPDRLRLLADILLSTRWTQADHLALRFGFTKGNPHGMQLLLTAVHAAFLYAPSRTQLVAFFHSHPQLLSGFRWKRLPDIRERGQLRPTRMNSAVGYCQSFNVPPLPTIGSLAEQLFHIPAPVLEWLGRSRVQHYNVRAIAKRGTSGRSGLRVIEQPKPLLKAAQRDIVREILRWVPAHPTAHGFIRGRSVVSFTQEHVGQQAVLRIDLENFFPSINPARVSAVFRSLGYPLPVTRVLTDLCTTSSQLDTLPELAGLARDEQLRLSALYGRRHLPQGAPTSPALANLVAFRLDGRLARLAEKAGCHYSRYADDLLFSGDRIWQRQAERFSTQVAAIVLDEGFQVNYRKTRLMPRATRQVATGVVLNERPNVDRRQYDNLKAILTNSVRFGLASQNRQQHLDFRAHLLGRIGWVRQVNPVRADKLMKIFNNIQQA